MRPTLPRLVRVVPRGSIDARLSKRIVDELPKEVREQPPLIELLMARKEEASDSYPSNIRIEPPYSRRIYNHLSPEKRVGFRKLIKEW